MGSGGTIHVIGLAPRVWSRGPKWSACCGCWGRGIRLVPPSDEMGGGKPRRGSTPRGASKRLSRDGTDAKVAEYRTVLRVTGLLPRADHLYRIVEFDSLALIVPFSLGLSLLDKK